MASHRKPRPGGTPGAGIGTPALAGPALATAALTSVAVLSQTAEAAPAAGGGRPSLEEVERKIDDLYRRAESAAEASAAGRERGGRVERSSGRGERAAGGRGERAERSSGRGERVAESAGAAGTDVPRRDADSLRRLRDEVARRAQHRALPGLRDMIPAQRGTGRRGTGEHRDGLATAGGPTTTSGGATRGATLAGGAGGTALTPPVRGRAVVPPVPDTAAIAPMGAGSLTAPTDTSAAAVSGTEATLATRATAGAVATTAAGATRATGVIEAAPSPRAATAPATATSEDTAVGPKAAKAAVQKKLAHARVLLSERIAQASAAPSGTYATKARKAIAFARAQLGKPCVWGAAGPDSYDCSGLTQAAWKSAGVTLPRTVREQADAGTPVAPADARPGDLVFFHDDAGHVGLCTGDGMMIHAPRPGAYVREEPVSGPGEPAVHSVVRPG
ncbi:C40 family peptidase [Streptomyces cinerochromogenes]|uniref:C40 family peptidase n=1 Tax=Streptomyces cinerochromogenes TaxID=66422 RepID=UPI0019CD17DA|nr:C40 family peptidase [Streptomyces cinerochromogenes]GGS64999.1 hypothetical protein GCM10010206_29330 [Streptomyces cinerochromogenes]